MWESLASNKGKLHRGTTLTSLSALLEHSTSNWTAANREDVVAFSSLLIAKMALGGMRKCWRTADTPHRQKRSGLWTLHIRIQPGCCMLTKEWLRYIRKKAFCFDKELAGCKLWAIVLGKHAPCNIARKFSKMTMLHLNKCTTSFRSIFWTWSPEDCHSYSKTRTKQNITIMTITGAQRPVLRHTWQGFQTKY